MRNFGCSYTSKRKNVAYQSIMIGRVIMKKLWDSLDRFICKYIGITSKSVTPNHLKKIGNHLLISNTEPFKRHYHTQNLADFFKTNFNQLDSSNKQKLGIALGKALAKNLVVSFDNVQIKREKLDA